MLGSIYIGLSGLTAYSKGLQTISNNVTNLNTPGFKATSFTFADSFSYGGLGASFSRYVGGQQLGSGVRYGAEKIDFRQGDLRQSGGDLDLALQGSGMLVLLDGQRTFYTRTGQFGVDKDGYISDTASGYRLAILNDAGQAVGVSVDANSTSPPTATSKINFSGNLSSTATEASVADMAVYDSRGTKHVWQARFAPVGATAPGEWTVTITDETNAQVGQATLKFIGSAVDPATAHLTIATTPAGADPLSVELNFSAGVTSFSSGTLSTLRAGQVDGNGLGTLSAVTVDIDGNIKLTYSNQKTELLGPVAIADFRDPQQLERIGAGLFVDKGGANVRLLASGQDGIGKLVPRQIEASNVDLSQQFGDLILVQRGFQASSQVISISNDMIQQLFGIRGQG
ncbi:MAG TPA: flagellar hook-basal body complex protein [Allosphingosinicella sp.]|nr:flagellar hook-basal body complex protein [Allosphingosinicella sp.]